MKKLMYVVLAMFAISFAACSRIENPPEPEDPEIDDPTVASNMKLFVDGIGEITEDRTITLHDAVLTLSGEMTMTVSGTIEGVEALRVIVTRSATGRKDELCAGKCSAGDGEEEQVFNFKMQGTTNTWYAHYVVPEQDHSAYTVNYKFINYSRVVNLTVVYDYQETE